IFESSAKGAAGWSGPVIHPKAAGREQTDPAVGLKSWNSLPQSEAAGNSSPRTDRVSGTGDGWTRSATNESRGAEWGPTGAGGTAPAAAGQQTLSEAQAIAAQMGLGAGSGNPLTILNPVRSPSAMDNGSSAPRAAPAPRQGKLPAPAREN